MLFVLHLFNKSLKLLFALYILLLNLRLQKPGDTKTETQRMIATFISKIQNYAQPYSKLEFVVNQLNVERKAASRIFKNWIRLAF